MIPHARHRFGDIVPAEYAAGDGVLREDFEGGPPGVDGGVHHRVGEEGLVAFVVSVLSVTPEVEDDVLAELLTVLRGESRREGHGPQVVGVDVDDQRLALTMSMQCSKSARTRWAW